MSMCLYNGVPLPAPPPCSKTEYPHWYIAQSKEGGFGVSGENVFICSSEPLHKDSLKIYTGDVPHAHYVYSPSNGDIDWVLFSENEDNVGFFHTIFTHLWTNTDILNTDGSVYLAASDPIPILAPVIDPLSMWLGYQAGQWVVRQRGKKAEEEKKPVAYLYGGMRAPDIAKLPYPFAFMFQAGGGVLAYCTSCPVIRSDGKPYRPFTENAVYYTESNGDTEWLLSDSMSIPDDWDPEIWTSNGVPVWMNYDYVDMEYVYLPGSGWPEEVQQMFGDFPALDTEKYPYWCIGEAVSTGITPDFCLFGSTEKGYWEDGVFKIGGTYCVFSAKVQGDETIGAFTLYGDNQTAKYPFSTLFYPMTSNYLAYTNDYDSSKAIIATSEPVPVYE